MSILHNIMFGASGGTAFSATGGTVTTVGAYTVHTFTTSGDFVVTGAKELDIFLVGKGGSGANTGTSGAGGGGGGEVLQTTYTFSTNTYGIRVGGAGTLYGTSEDYSALQLAVDNILIQADRGSNGDSTGQGIGGASGNGYAGGAKSNECGSGGGGGGASQVGYNGGNYANASRGGDGLSNDWRTGTPTYYGGGGGGGKNACTQTNFGGQGGGGNGATAGTSPKNAATAGAANTGGGGGGGAVPDVTNGRSGGTGIVIIRYLT